MNIMILDSEGISLTKPFAYDIGYIICEVRGKQLVEIDRKWLLVEQIFNNTMLFSTAYYGKKRPRYLQMRKNSIIKTLKAKEVFEEIGKDVEKYDISGIYAYNKDYDENSLDFTANWFKVVNPLADVPYYDIWAYADIMHDTEMYKGWCVKNDKISNANNVMTGAEVTYQYMINDPSFIEQHTSVEDCEIEKEILQKSLQLGRVLGIEYQRNNHSVKKQQKMTILRKMKNGTDEWTTFKYSSKRKNQKLNGFILTE